MEESKERTEGRQLSSERPPLTPEISIHDFRNFYWYLDELAKFCRQLGLPTSGQKLDLVARIEMYLTTGTIDKKNQPKKSEKSKTKGKGPITLDSVVTNDYRCNDETRAFFKSVIGDHFHFTAHLQKFRRENKHRTLTYGDLAREWAAEYERRKDKNYKPKIEKTWEYNQFVRDYMADRERNAGKSMRDAAKAWNLVRTHQGPHTYEEYKKLRQNIE
jgi:hypothetical protein